MRACIHADTQTYILITYLPALIYSLYKNPVYENLNLAPRPARIHKARA